MRATCFASSRRAVQNAFGWDKAEADIHLHKVMAELTRGDTQTTLHQFYVMKYEDGVRAAGVRSKRMKKALKRIHAAPGLGANGSESDSSSGSGKVTQRSSKAQTGGTKRARQSRSTRQPGSNASALASKQNALDIADDVLLKIAVDGAAGEAASSASDSSEPNSGHAAVRAACVNTDSDPGSSTDEDLKFIRRKPRKSRRRVR